MSIFQPLEVTEYQALKIFEQFGRFSIAQ